MRIAYFTPIQPLKSGISDFSEELIEYLKKLCELSVFVPDMVSLSDIEVDYDIHNITEYAIQGIRDSYDLAVFHVGNNYQFHNQIVEVFLKYGGILELHDIALHHYYAESTIARGMKEQYIEIMEYCHGSAGKERAERYLAGKDTEPWSNESLKYTLNKLLIDKADGVIVHSWFAYEMVKGVRPYVPVEVIYLHTPDIIDDIDEQKNIARKELNIPENQFVMGAFGIASKEKQIYEIITALHMYKSFDDNFHFYIVGDDSGIDVEKIIKKYDLLENVTLLGYTELDVFKNYMKACDVAFNLRYPTQGESSAALIRLLGVGKPVFVNTVGSFKEFPDDVVIKIDPGENEPREIYDRLVKLKGALKQYQINALEFARINCSLEGSAEKYMSIFNNLKNHECVDNYADILITKIQEAIGLEENYSEHIYEKIIF